MIEDTDPRIEAVREWIADNFGGMTFTRGDIAGFLAAADRAAWRPIETAPKEPLNQYQEGPRVLLYSGHAIVGRWRQTSRTKAWVSGGGIMLWNAPTHWQPLPPPPGRDNV